MRRIKGVSVIIKGLDARKAYRWRKTYEIEKWMAEAFLKERERYCVAACARFRALNFNEDSAWMFSSGSETAAMLLQSRRTLFPVFDGEGIESLPPHLARALGGVKIHALHGLSRDVETLFRGIAPAADAYPEQVDFCLMALDSEAELGAFKTMPPGLALRRPRAADIEELLPLQSAYEREEVLPSGALLNERGSLLNLKHIVSEEIALIAEINGRIVGKINTNAQGYSRCQIGGVYVPPAFRRKGIARCMITAFSRILFSRGFALTLFVRKTNHAAISAYVQCGFKTIADYRILYL
jgi:predicted GNAT family acetyltransferase